MPDGLAIPPDEFRAMARAVADRIRLNARRPAFVPTPSQAVRNLLAEPPGTAN